MKLEKRVYQQFVDSPELRAFVEHVFQQVDVDVFMRIFREAVESQGDIYQILLRRAPEAKGNFFTQTMRGLRALFNERKSLANNVSKLMDPSQSSRGYVEIGLPGRMVSTVMPRMGVSGRCVVVNEYESRLQSGLLRKPYDAFVPLTYAPLEEPPQSAGVISCFAGLHHCPEEKLDAFIASIHSTLEEGGVFLLREHDACDEKMTNLSSVVHSVFNALTDVAEDAEAAEVRAFRSRAEWVLYLEERGFTCVSEGNYPVRDNDSSKNTLLKFVKGKDPLITARQKLISQNPHYKRPDFHTFLTRVEWWNVESAQNIGKDAKHSWMAYPYLSDVWHLWRGYGHSIHAAHKEANLLFVLSSSHNAMCLVLALMMTVDYVAKGILFSPGFFLVRSGLITPNTQNPYDQWLQKYGKELEVTPFYAHNYIGAIRESWNSAFLFSSIVLTIDLLFRAAVSAPLHYMYGDTGDDRDIGVITKKPDGTFSGQRLPRYKGLETALKTIPEGEELVELAGNTYVQVDLLVKREEVFPDALYEMPALHAPEQKLVAVKITLPELQRLLKDPQAPPIHRIYDF